jgi:serine/threonine protein kinase
MSHAATSSFFEGLRTTRLLDEARIAELEGRPEAAWGDVVSLGEFALKQGWLTPYQLTELREGRGHRLVVGAYHVFDRIADGPAGAAFKALHPSIPQPVALNVLRPEWLAPSDNAPDYVSRLQSASLVQHPHLATILDAGTLDGSPYVVEELVDGGDLFHLVNEMGALPVGLACEYARQAAQALRAAHEKGVVHGDVSPHSLHLTPVKRTSEPNGDVSIRPRPGARIKLIGLCRSPLRLPLGEMTYGETDRLGAVAFLAPERHTSAERTPAGDLYGLGASLYFLLTTRPPYPGDSPAEIMLNVQQGEPAALETLRSEIPPPVADVVRRLLSRDPAARPTAAETIDVLQPHCEPSAAPEEPVAPGVLLASGTDTQAKVPTALPGAGDESALLPTVEPLPEFHPLEDSAHGDSGTFGSSAFGTSAPGVRPRAKPTKKNAVWVIAGLILHLSAVVLLVGYLTNWFAFLRSPEPPAANTVEDKKDLPARK